MTLRLVTRSGPPEAGGESIIEDLEGRPFTIGREATNDWVLPSQVVSRHHCTLEQSGDRWFLTDTSTNGVYVGDSSEPVGSGNSIELADGQRLYVGDYELEVRFDRPRRANDFASESDLTELEVDPDRQVDLPSISNEEEKLLGFKPLPSYEEWERLKEPVHLSSALDQDHPTGDDFEPPQPAPRLPEPPPPVEPPAGPALLPDDWSNAVNEDTEAGHAPEFVKEPPLERGPPPLPDSLRPTHPDRAILPPEAAVQALGVSSGGRPELSSEPGAPALRSDTAARLLDAFYAGAGIEAPDVVVEPIQMMRTIGEIVRSVTEGALRLLDARSRIKAEMGVEQTILAAHGNNPLKFSSDAGQALCLLFNRRESGYLPPRQAYTEAFEDIVEHELSLLTGVQEAWTELLARLDPEALEHRIGKEKGLSALLLSRKARCWDVFCERYREISSDADRIFKLKVASAYERKRGYCRRRSR